MDAKSYVKDRVPKILVLNICIKTHCHTVAAKYLKVLGFFFVTSQSVSSVQHNYKKWSVALLEIGLLLRMYM